MNRFLILMIGIAMLLGNFVSHAQDAEIGEEIDPESLKKSANDYILENYEVDPKKIEEINKSEHAEIMLAHLVRAIGGEAESQNALALFYKLGEGVAKDYREAFNWSRKSVSKEFRTGVLDSTCPFRRHLRFGGGSA